MNLTIYHLGDSRLHTFDARLKTGGLIWLSALMTATSWRGLLLSSLALAVLAYMSQLPVKLYRSSAVSLIWLAVFYGLGFGWVWTESWYFWQGHWSMDGLQQAGLILWRIALIFLMTRIFMAVTPPLEQGLSIAFFFNPLSRLWPKAGDFALLLTLTLRFIPLLAEEAGILWKARLLKGDLPDSRLKRLGALAGLTIPLLMLSLRRSEEVAENLVLRGFVPGKYRVVSMNDWSRADTRGLLIVGLFGLLLLLA